MIWFKACFMTIISVLVKKDPQISLAKSDFYKKLV
jgi:hypothetical protein